MANFWRVVVAHSATDHTRRARSLPTHSRRDTRNSTRYPIPNGYRPAGKPSAATVGSGVDAAFALAPSHHPADDSPSTQIACGGATLKAVRGAIESAQNAGRNRHFFPVRCASWCIRPNPFSGRDGQTVSRNRSLFAHPEHTGANNVKLG